MQIVDDPFIDEEFSKILDEFFASIANDTDDDFFMFDPFLDAITNGPNQGAVTTEVIIEIRQPESFTPPPPQRILIIIFSKLYFNFFFTMV